MTAAGFLPIGFAVSSTGEYAGAIFSVVGDRAPGVLARGRHVHALSRREAAAERQSPSRRRSERHLRHADVSPPARRGRLVRATTASGSSGRPSPRSCSRSSGSAISRSNSSRHPSGPSCSCSFACRKAARSARRSPAAKQAEQLLAGDDDAATWTTYVGAGPPRFWLGLNPALPNEAYAEIVIVAKDIKARERLKNEDRHGGRERRRCRSARADRPLQFRTAGRLSRPVPGDRQPIRRRSARWPTRCATSCAPIRDMVEPQLDWDGQMPSVKLVLDQDRTRALGLDPQTRVAEPAGARHRLSGHDRARPDREGRGGGPRDREPAQRSRLDRRPHRAGAQRRAGSGLAGRTHRAGPRRRDLVAPQSRPRDHCARRHSRRRAGSRRVETHLGRPCAAAQHAADRLPLRDGRRRSRSPTRPTCRCSPSSRS